ncbi:MAG: efflux RND transporter permease subunit [Planctomycetota bacterium]
MLNRIIAFSLKNRIFILAASLLVAVYGTYMALEMPIDVLPDINRPTVIVMAEAHDLVPEDIERQVTLPLEQILNGATNVMRVRSGSGMGLSMLFVEFDWGTDIYRNRQIVQEKLQLARSKLPPDVMPHLAPITSIMGQIQLIGVLSKSGDTHPDELRTLADYHIKYRLLSIPGVAQVVNAGGAPRELQVIPDVDKLRAHEVTLGEVADTIRKANLNVSGGFMTIGHKAPMITLKGLLVKREELGDAVVKNDPLRPVRIKDVARVDFGPAAIRTGEAGVNGEPGIILAVSKQPDSDSVELTREINRELESIREGLPEDIVLIDDVFQQAQFIERAVENVVEAVWIGAVLVVIVLFVFLMTKRLALITLTAIPLSIAITAIVFAAFGLSINTMTLGGLAVAIGALVDDAIVGVENVYRRLRENAKRPKSEKRNPLLVIFRASSEVRRPILIGTFLVVIVYLPLFYLTGLEGRLFTPIGAAYITSILASLLVSITLTPALCYLFLSKSKKLEATGDSWLVHRLKTGVSRMIRFSINRPVEILSVLLALVAGSAFLLTRQGTQFLPPFNEGVAQINLFLPPETGLDASSEFGQRLGKLLTKIEGVKHVGRRTGRAEGDEHVHGVNFSHTIITFNEDSERSRKSILSEIREKLAKEFPGVMTEVSQPLDHMLSHMLSGVKAQVAIKVFGPDLNMLRRVARQVEDAVRPIPGVVDLFTEPQVLIDHIVIEPRRELMARHGVNVHDAAEVVELALEGEKISLMQVGLFAFPVVMRLEEKDRLNLNSIRNLYIHTDEGERIRLSEVADVELSMTPNNINRENVARRIAVQHNVEGRSLGEVVADVEIALKPIREQLSESPGYTIRIGGQFEAQQEATRLITLFSLISLVAMFFVLFLHFRSVNLSLQVLMSIPMAFIGAVVYVVLSGQAVSVATLVGFISLGGIASRNGILLIDHYLHLMREENEPFSPAMLIRAGQERMVPVVMTALTTGIALIPLALAPDQPGREILFPVATVIIGGLISSTLLDFLVRPALFWVFGKKEAERLAAVRPSIDRASEEIAKECEVHE